MAKICPSCRYQSVDDNALFCNKCGFPFPESQPARRAVATAPASRPAPAPARRIRKKPSGASGFLSFETLITTKYLKLIYIIGAVLIILVSVMGVAGMFAKPIKKTAATANVSFINTTAIAQDPASSPVFWIGFLVIGSLLWRMFCELFVILGRVHNGHGHEEEAEEYYEPGEYGEEEYEMPGGEESGQMVECPKCDKIVPVEDLRECEHCGVQGCSSCIRMMGLLKKTMTCRECFEAK